MPPDLKHARRRKVSLTEAFRTDRLPPHSTEAEQGVLGCVLLAPQCLQESVQILKDGADEFYDLRHQMIYQALLDMSDKGHATDVITLQQHLKDTQPTDADGKPKDGNQLDLVGGLAYLASLPDTVPSAANLSYYANIVHEKYILRQMIEGCTEVIGRLYDWEGEIDAVLDQVQERLLKVCGLREQSNHRTARELVHGAIQTIEQMHAAGENLLGISTGLQDLDRITDGLRAGEMIVIAGRPSVGKSSLAMQIAEHVASELRLPVGVFSLEMTAESLMVRTLCAKSGVSIKSVRSGMGERDFPKLTHVAGKMAGAPLFIDDTASMTVMQFRQRARQMAHHSGIKLIVLDYLGLMQPSRRRHDNRQQEIAEISAGVKATAKELGIPVIVLSQLNREVEKRANNKPNLSDLRDSGAIEQDADVVALLYRDTKTKEDESDSETGVVRLNIAKQRNGPTGEIDLIFNKPLTRFSCVARIDEQDIPVTN